MEKNLKKLIKSLNTGKNVEEALREYMDALTGHYYEISLLNLAMNYVTLYEKMLEDEKKLTDSVQPLYEQVNTLALRVFSEEGERDEILMALIEQRKRITCGMQALTQYIDKLDNYEYVLNRKELSFEPVEETEEDTVFINEVLQYIFESRDNTLVNERLKEILGQLPVRMARSRYFDLIRESYSVYKDSDRSALDTYDYMLRTCAMLYEPEEQGTMFPEFEAFLKELSEEDFNGMDKERYNSLVKRLKEAAAELVHISDLYALLQETVNDLYAYLLALPYGNGETSESVLACVDIIQAIIRLVKSGGEQPASENMMEKFRKTEGRQEALQYTRDMLEAALPEVRQNYADLALKLSIDGQLKDLSRMERLLSNSLFMDPDAALEEAAGEDYIKQKTGEMLKDLEDSFKGRARCINRAVIANTINKMPVFFHTAQEVADYIGATLAQCTDAGEKTISMRLIRGLMEEAKQL